MANPDCPISVFREKMKEFFEKSGGVNPCKEEWYVELIEKMTAKGISEKILTRIEIEEFTSYLYKEYPDPIPYA